MGSGQVFIRKPIACVIFHGGGQDPTDTPSGSTHAHCRANKEETIAINHDWAYNQACLKVNLGLGGRRSKLLQ